MKLFNITKLKKYRVIQAGDLFYPQWKIGFIWRFYSKLIAYDMLDNIKFDTYNKAVAFIEANEIRKYPYKLRSK